MAADAAPRLVSNEAGDAAGEPFAARGGHRRSHILSGQISKERYRNHRSGQTERNRQSLAHANPSSSVFASFRSAVSKPSVNEP
jgi:hypothetical protein